MPDALGWSGLEKAFLAVLNPLFWVIPERTALSLWGPLTTGLLLLAVALPAAPARKAPARGADAGAVVVVVDVLASFRSFFGRDKDILHGVRFLVREGRILGLLGRNGAGKTTTLRTILGELAPGRGRVVWDPPAAGMARFLPEFDPLAEGLRPRHYLPLFADPVDGGRLERLAQLLHLGAVLDTRAGALSFGQRRRAALLLTVAAAAPLYLLDEPAAGIDPVELEAVKDLLRRLRDEGRAVVLSTHLLREFEDVNDVVLLDGGRVVATGPVADLRGRVAVVARERGDERPTALPAGSVRSGSRIIVPAQAREALLAALAARGDAFREVPPTLHDVFTWAVTSPLATGGAAR